jgi:hypothetical protein
VPFIRRTAGSDEPLRTVFRILLGTIWLRPTGAQSGWQQETICVS